MATSGFGSGGRAGVGIALLGVLAACASGGASGGGWEVGRQWGCDPAEVRRDYEESHPQGAGSLALTPREGWSACQLLSLVGAPDEVRTAESDAGVTYLLFYPGAARERVVTLRRDVTQAWRVSAVVW